MQQESSTLLTVKQMVLIHTKYNEGTTKSIESSLCNYSDTYVLVTGNVTVEWADNNKTVALKNSAPFRKCRTEINDALLMMQNTSTLQCLCTIWLNIVVIFLILQKVYGSLREMK